MDLSIIIPSYNTKTLLDECLQSIYNETRHITFEVIVVDNGSTDGSIEMMNKKYTQVKLYKNKDNVGFGTANNQGAKIAKGKWLLLLNSDTKIVNQAIDNLFTYIQSLPRDYCKKTIIGCQLLNKDGSIQPSAGYFPSLFRVLTQMFFLDDIPFWKHVLKPYQQNNISFYIKEQIVDWVTGAFLLIPSKIYNEISGFDESIFMYGEEVDLCYRVKMIGGTVLYTPKVSIFHNKGASSQNGFVSAVLGEYKGLLTFYKKYYSDKVRIMKMILKLGALLRIVVFGMIKPEKAYAYKEALVAI